jgi:alkaline phosphatase D
MAVDWVNAVQRTQAGHLPDPVDPQPLDSGIEVYFTEMRYGGVSFAIVEDRKFKTGPNDILTERQRAAGRTNPDALDAPGAEMFGPRQEAFLKEWAKSSADADFRVVCSQTILCKATTHAGRDLARAIIDLDCGGWPQSARNRALKILQAAPDVIMLHGDQHTGTLVRQGVDDWEDSALAFMVPGTSNGFPRAWWPEGSEILGRFRDGFGHRMTILAAANPDEGSNTKEGQAGLDAEEVAHIKGSGHGIVLLDRGAKKATFEIWRHRGDEQFLGFPVTVEL